ncbi:4'-phosphopantetheinyl transferase superfamily protein [Actinokineospora alba]|uniref:4'-phosphopantetheinyl transferase superfamily protein n=1 Tax=Actinokineospora alba TaxID=504798 RepID=A0A1H0FVF0_9PSEU|nr:4'-phosphopantetheinyl transferase superfamily protein [Actinokineospora alba]TDP69630.1 4'-phosphopantetheinyl transferase superfamily protein [Actinokineospora alba]SDI12584.1 4'-phosphopantetheinyl transferase superfamily protein [Actinokineospora alba]SDN98459.1 4'-phosphopantetheinyl transferase superfamily protein [Actinokineospora alba]
MSLEQLVPAAVAEGAHVKWHPVRTPRGRAEQSAAGRAAAAAALAEAGSTDLVVPREPDGRPRFPQGFAGAIAHTDSVAVAVVVPGAEAVGVDIEDAVISPRVARFVLRDRERAALLRPDGAYSARDLFSAKEAAFKALCSLGGGGGLGGPDQFLFWRIELDQVDGTLVASHRGVAVPVWVRSEPRRSLAVAIRR